MDLFANNTGPEYSQIYSNSSLADGIDGNPLTLKDSAPNVNIRKMLLWFIITGSIMGLVIILWCIYMFIEYKDVLSHNWQHFWGHPGELHFTLNRFRLARMMENRARMLNTATVGKRRQSTYQANNEDRVDSATTTHILLKGVSHNNA